MNSNPDWDFFYNNPDDTPLQDKKWERGRFRL
jgi:hypothetical protein